jgi:site-specific DNA recombinase
MTKAKATDDLLPCVLLRRISEDPNDLQNGIARQAKLGPITAERLGWRVVETYTDNDVSAWKDNAKRPDFERLLGDIRSGKVRAVVAQNQARIARTSAVWGTFRRLCKKHGVRVAYYADGEVPIGTTAGGVSTGIRAVLDEGESEAKSDLLIGFSDERAMAGRTANRVMYGWRRVVTLNDRGVRVDWHDEIHPEHAAIMREIAERFIRGESLRGIANDLNARGEVTPNHGRRNEGRLWRVPTLTQLLKRPANIGQRVHRKEILPGVVAQAPAILDRETYAKCLALLADPTRRTVNDHRIKNLLTGIASCGVCGSRARLSRVQKKATHKVWVGYTCQDKGCVGCDVEVVDAIVTEYAIAYLDTIDAAALLSDEGNTVTQAAAQVDALNARLVELRNMLGDGELSRAEYNEQKARIAPKLSTALALAKITVSPGLDGAYRLSQSDDTRAAWEASPLMVKRAMIVALFDVVINKGKRNDPTRISVTAK